MKKILLGTISFVLLIVGVPKLNINAQDVEISDDLKKYIIITQELEEENPENLDFKELAKNVEYLDSYYIGEDEEGNEIEFNVFDYQGIEYFTNLSDIGLHVDVEGNHPIKNFTTLHNKESGYYEEPYVYLNAGIINENGMFISLDEYFNEDNQVSLDILAKYKETVLNELKSISNQYNGPKKEFELEMDFGVFIDNYDWLVGLKNNAQYSLEAEVDQKFYSVPVKRVLIDDVSFFEINITADQIPNIVFDSNGIYKIASSNEQVSGIDLYMLVDYLSALSEYDDPNFLLTAKLTDGTIFEADDKYFFDENHDGPYDEKYNFFFGYSEELDRGRIESINLKFEENEINSQKLIEHGHDYHEYLTKSFDYLYEILDSDIYDYNEGLSILNYAIDSKGNVETDFNVIGPVFNFYLEESYTVDFESNGGTKVETIQDVPKNSLITKPNNPSKEGYDFVAWYSDQDLKNKWNFELDKVSSDMTLYAKWETEKYTVDFESNGGTKVESIKDIEKDSLITQPEKPSKEGYEFVAWYSDQDLKNKWNFELDKVVSDMTLYAKWEKITEAEVKEKYTVDFESNGGTKVESIKDIEKDSLITQPNNPSKEGYDFVAWYSDQDLKNKWDFKLDKVVSDMTLYAKWEKITEAEVKEKYTVDFESNGGTKVESIKDIEKDSLITQPEKPSKEGYDFVAWYSDQDLKNKWDFKLDKVSSDMTLYAKWEKKTINTDPITNDKNEEKLPSTGVSSSLGFNASMVLVGVLLKVFYKKED